MIGCAEDKTPKLSETLNQYGLQYNDWVLWKQRTYGNVVNPYVDVIVTNENELAYNKLLVMYNVTGGSYYLQHIFPALKTCQWNGYNADIAGMLLYAADNNLKIDNARIDVLSGADIPSGELNSTYQTYLAGGIMYQDLATTFKSYTVNSLNEKYYRIYSYLVAVYDRALLDTAWAELGYNQSPHINNRNSARTKANSYALLAGYPTVDYQTIDGMASII